MLHAVLQSGLHNRAGAVDSRLYEFVFVFRIGQNEGGGYMQHLVAAWHDAVPAGVVVEIGLDQFDQVSLFRNDLVDWLVLLLVFE